MLEEIKRSLELKGNDHDAQLKDFIKRVSSRLAVRAGQGDVPGELEYIVVELVIERWNRKGNEGMESYSQEGESIKYSVDDELDKYARDIADWKKGQEEHGGYRGRVSYW